MKQKSKRKSIERKQRVIFPENSSNGFRKNQRGGKKKIYFKRQIRLEREREKKETIF